MCDAEVVVHACSIVIYILLYTYNHACHAMCTSVSACHAMYSVGAAALTELQSICNKIYPMKHDRFESTRYALAIAVVQCFDFYIQALDA